MSKLGSYDKKYYARKCYIDSVSCNDKNEFLEDNHLQGKDKSKYYTGLYCKETKELLSVMTFGKRQLTGSKIIDWELIRFCNKKNTTIVGGASKLFKNFTRNVLYDGEVVKTYADRRYSNGKLYEKLGFTLKHISSPNYWYIDTKNLKLKHRLNFQKHKLVNILDKFDHQLTEWENMQNNGYDRIWDCGNYVFEYIK